MVIRRSVRYLAHEAGYFIDVFEERRHPGGPPEWSPDGGGAPYTLIRADGVEGGMSREAPAEDEVLTPDELSEALAEATGTTAEEIERGADEIEMSPPDEAEIVDE